jgi:predicted transcriptional regulator
MTNHNITKNLSRRERQIMDVIYELGEARVAQVMERIEDAPGYSSVRKILQILEVKGHVLHKQIGQHYVYLPTQPRQKAAQSAMRQVLQTFFAGNIQNAVLTLMSEAEVNLSEDDITRLTSLIEAAKQDKQIS